MYNSKNAFNINYYAKNSLPLNNTFGNDQNLSEQALCLVSAATDPANMEILYANKTLGTIFGIKESNLVGKNIKLIMPNIIRNSHD